LIGGVQASSELVSSDRFLFKVVDQAVSIQDLKYQLRNLKALNCVYSDALVIQYFDKKFIEDFDSFIIKFPENSEGIIRYLHSHEDLLNKMSILFKMLRYAEDQNKKVSAELSKLVQSSAKANRCNLEVLHKDSLKTNFKSLLEIELYLRARYEGQFQTSGKKIDEIRSSLDLFIESLNKQFSHEFYW
jgi:hypothetical protein